MASRSLDDLHYLFKPVVETFLRTAEEGGVELLVTCTFRSGQEQAKLYSIGRTMPGRIVTYAKPGHSLHNVMLAGKPAALAVDVVPMVFNKPLWDARDPVWTKLGEIGEGCGLNWAGRWRKFREFPHFEAPVGLTANIK